MHNVNVSDYVQFFCVLCLFSLLYKVFLSFVLVLFFKGPILEDFLDVLYREKSGNLTTNGLY